MKGDKMDTRMNRRWIVLALIGMVALGANPETLNEKVRRLEAQNKLLASQVASLKRKLAIKNPPPATRPVVPVFRTPRRCWSDADLFIEHVRIRDIMGLRKPDDSPAAWLKKNKGFVGRAVTWRGVVVNSVGRAATKTVTTEVAVGRHGLLTLQVVRGYRDWKEKKGDVVVAEGIIEKIDIQPTEVQDGQVVHGAITVHITGGLQQAQRIR